jgi:photosystem II stability/assembly factor-like uncharacterized protein
MSKHTSKSLLLLPYVAIQLISCHDWTAVFNWGATPSGAIRYESMPSDTSFPEPTVIEVSNTEGRSKIQIKYNSEDSGRPDNFALIETSDEGQHWEKSQPRTADSIHAAEFSTIIYRYDEKGIFERSRDKSDHWERPEFRIKGFASQIGDGTSVDRQAALRFTFSGSNPQKPASIYGCLKPRNGSPPEKGEMGTTLPSGLYVSFDAGDNWSLLTEEVQNERSMEGCPLGISPSNPAHMIAHGRTSLIVSRDGGKKWKPIGDRIEMEKPAQLQGYAENLAALKRKGLPVAREWPFEWTYLLIKQIQFTRDEESVAFLVTNKGLYKTIDGARTWCLLDTGPRKLFDVHSLYIDPTRRGRIFVGTRLKVLVSDDLGCHFRTFFDSAAYIALGSPLSR